MIYNFPYAGYVTHDSLVYIGSSGSYWSRTAITIEDAGNMYISSTNVATADPAIRYVGLSVRCVATT